jgi:phosphotransferase system enzyme I (PtsI)
MKREKCDNPALGMRGIRMLLSNKKMLVNQLRAILKVSSMGNIKIMFPMINSIKEVLEAKNILENEKHKLLINGESVADNIKIGIMVETPASLLSLHTFVNHIDFISVGTNDLTQYILATDRNNENVALYYDNYHPAIVKSLKMIYEFSLKYDIPTTLCGELNTDFKFLPYLLGLGFNRFSVNPIFINNMSKFIKSISISKCENRLKRDYGDL